ATMATELHVSPLFESTHKPPIPACPPVHVVSRSVPQWLQSFTSRLSADLSSAFPSPINHVLVNEYHEGQGIMPHQDGPAYFPCVAILSLGLPGTMAFSPHQRLLEGSSESGRESSEGACEAALDLMHAQHQRLLEGGREEVLGESEREGDGNDVMEREEAGKKNSSGDAVGMRESVALPPRSLLVFKDQAYTGELVWGEAGEWGSSGDAVEMREGVALPPRSLLVFKDQACTGNEISCASPSRAVIETASVTTRRAALIALSAVIAAQCAGERGAAAAAAGEDGKQRGLSVEQVKDIIARDISEGQYFVTGDLTASIYRDDCRFKDPTNDTSGLARYLAAVSILFDPAFSKQELLSIAVTSDKSVTATWRLGGYLKFPWQPRVEPFTGMIRWYATIPGTVDIPEGAGNSTQYSDLTCLALYQQAVHGPCNKPKPWAWNIVELAKWQSWTELGKMAPVEAMRLFVRALEHAAAAVAAEGYNRGYPDAYAAEGFLAMNGAAFPRGPPVVEDMGVMAVLRSHDCINKWVAAPVTGRKPLARYQVSCLCCCYTTAGLALALNPSHLFPRGPPVVEDMGVMAVLRAHDCINKWVAAPVTGRKPSARYQDMGVMAVLRSHDCINKWVAAPVTGRKPFARYQVRRCGRGALLRRLKREEAFGPIPAEILDGRMYVVGGNRARFNRDVHHAAEILDGRMYVVGGIRARFTSDVHVLDLSLSPSQPLNILPNTPPPCVSLSLCVQHAAEILDGRMYVVGGNRARFTSDVHVLDLASLAWSKMELSSPANALPPCAGHSLVILDEVTLLCIGGFFKDGAEKMIVRALDVSTKTWRVMKTRGQIPCARGGHSTAKVGSTVWVFGGEDSKRRLLNDVYSLDLTTFVWDKLDTTWTPREWVGGNEMSAREWAVVGSGDEMSAREWAVVGMRVGEQAVQVMSSCLVNC
ncbi:unnamed protein product, partial [Closterium sp. NIES-65]